MIRFNDRPGRKERGQNEFLVKRHENKSKKQISTNKQS